MPAVISFHWCLVCPSQLQLMFPRLADNIYWFHIFDNFPKVKRNVCRMAYFSLKFVQLWVVAVLFCILTKVKDKSWKRTSLYSFFMFMLQWSLGMWMPRLLGLFPSLLSSGKRRSQEHRVSWSLVHKPFICCPINSFGKKANYCWFSPRGHMTTKSP